MGKTLKAEEVRRLLSEYAAGTISDSDRRILTAAALEDQALFDALAMEQPLADLMTDPASRLELREALETQHDRRGFAWLWRRLPMTVAATAMVAILAVLVTLYIPQSPLSPEIRSIARRADAPQAPVPPTRAVAGADKSIGGVVGALPDGVLPDKGEAKANAQGASVPVSPRLSSGKGSSVELSKEQPELLVERKSAPVPLPPPGGGRVTIRPVQVGPARFQPAEVPRAVLRAIPATSPVPAPPPLTQAEMKGEVADRVPGGVVGGIVGGIPGGVVGGILGGGGVSPTLPPPARSEAKGGAAGGIAGGVPGGVVGGMVGGIVPAAEAPKAAGETTQAAAAADEASRLKKDLRLSFSPAVDLTCQLLRRGPDGLFQEVPRDTLFHAGDAARVSLITQSAGYLAVAEQADDGSWKLLFPAEGTSAIRIEQQTFVTLPIDRAWEFGTAARNRTLIAVFTAEPQAPLIAPDGTLRRPERGTILDIILKAIPQVP